MNTTATTTATPGAIRATPNPISYTQPHPIDDTSGAGSPKSPDSSRVLLFCLRGIVVFFWAVSRRTVERMLLSYLQSTASTTLRTLITNLTAFARGDGSGSVQRRAPAGEEARALNDREGAVTYQAGSACVNSKKVSWTYMRGAFSRLYPLFRDRVIERGGETRLSVVCRCLPCLERTLPRQPLRRRAHSPLCHPGPQYVSRFHYYMRQFMAQTMLSETAPKFVCSARTACGERRA